MRRLQERWATAQDREPLVKEQNTVLKEERSALLLAKDAALREMQNVVKVGEIALNTYLLSV